MLTELKRDLDLFPLETWEILALQSGYPDRPNDIYKLFMRRPKGWWYLIEDDVKRVRADYPTVSGYGQFPNATPGTHTPKGAIRGSADQLRNVGVDGRHGGKSALTQALAEIKSRLKAQ
jgi:hypothetical protein